MNEDKLKKYIDDHRSEFDMETPPYQVWSAIEKKLDEGRKSKVVPLTSGKSSIGWRIMKIAAAVVFLLSAGAMTGVYVMNQQLEKDISLAIQNPTHRSEFKEASNYYTSQIDSKLNELQQYKGDKSVLEDLNQIDQVSNELKLEVLKNPDQDQDLLVKEMIKQYQTKLDVLNKILDKIHESQSIEHNNNNHNNKTNKSTNQHDTLNL